MKMARAPNRAQREVKAFSGEATSPASSAPAAAALNFLRAVKMKKATTAKKAPSPRKAMSMLRSDSPRVAAVTTAPVAKTPPVSSTVEPR